MLTAAQVNAYSRRVGEVYDSWMQPVNRRWPLPANGLDILLFLANNQGYETAREICRYRHLKPGAVSLAVEKLVQQGFLRRESVPGDRRKDRLVCTENAAPIIAAGRERQEQFIARLKSDLTEEEWQGLQRYLQTLDQTLDRMKKEGE